MHPSDRRRLGKAAIEVPILGFGGVALGELFTPVEDSVATETLSTAWSIGVRYFDTAPLYGRGLSEHRIGRLLREKTGYVLSTKVGRVLHPSADPASFDASPWVGGLPFDFRFDYTYDGIMRSYEDSLMRLGLPRVDLLVIHDLDYWFHRTDFRVGAFLSQLATSGWRALEELRSGGLIKAIGAGINDRGLMKQFLDAVDVDFFLLAMRYTLMEQDVLDEELPNCVAANVGIVIGSVFSSGITATGAVPGARYNYAEPSPAVIDKVNRLEAICRGFGVPLPAVAMQFPLGHPAVAAVLPGGFQPEHVRSAVGYLSQPIPAQLWDTLKDEGLIRVDAPTPGI